jgi:hypothetical protein
MAETVTNIAAVTLLAAASLTTAMAAFIAEKRRKMALQPISVKMRRSQR